MNTLNYKCYYDSHYDFIGEKYSSLYPYLHKYPATMIPQIGIKLLNDYNISKDAKMLDPYCGSGSSFVSGLHHGISNFTGYDLNPLAVMITQAKITYIDKHILNSVIDTFISKLNVNIKLYNVGRISIQEQALANITNRNYWLSKQVQNDLLVIYYTINEVIIDINIKNLVLLAFSTTLREVSYVRNSEFKLFRMKNVDSFIVDSVSIFIKNLNKIVNDYLNYYHQMIMQTKPIYNIYNKTISDHQPSFDIILTSPPYGDSRTTVAYGQFSTFINEWLGFKEARKLDKQLLGGKVDKNKKMYDAGIIADYIVEISKQDVKRAYEVSAFYYDLAHDIAKFSRVMNKDGKVFFVVSNRTVKGVELPTDKFIAETFEYYGLKHIETIKRRLTNKTMPLRNSPTNKAGKTATTMNYEYIVVCSM